MQMIMDDDLRDEEDIVHRPSGKSIIYFLKRSLTSPIRVLNIRLLTDANYRERTLPTLNVRAQISYSKFEDAFAFALRKHPDNSLLFSSDQHVPYLLKNRLSLNIEDITTLENDIGVSFLAAKANVVFQTQPISKAMAVLMDRRLNALPRGSEIHRLMSWYYVMSRVMSYISSRGKKPVLPEAILSVSDSTYYWKLSPSSDVYFNSDGVMLTEGKTTMVLTYDCFANLCDLSCSHVNARLCNVIKEVLHDPSSLPMQLYESIIMWGCDVLETMGIVGYDMLANFEAMVTNSLFYGIDGEEDEYVDNQFEIYLVAECETLPPHLKESTLSLMEFLRSSNIHARSEAFGMFRFWGHPVVDGHEGLAKIQKVGNQPKNINLENVMLLSATFNKLVVEGCVSKYHRWPNCTINLPEGHEFHRCKRLGIFPHREHRDNSLEAWSMVEFAESFQIPSKMNLSDMIEDKSTSPDMPQLKKSWDNHRGVGYAQDKKVILQWLNSGVLRPVDVLREIEANGFARKELLIGITPKEREMKRVPRVFSLMTFYVRLYFVMTEGLISDNILPLFKQITMTLSSVELLKRLCSITKNQSRKFGTQKGRWVTINIDFEKWNHNMRDVTTRQIFEQLDRLHGFRDLISRTHPLFESVMFYLAEDGTQLEFDEEGNLKESDWTFAGTFGGQEGLRQKGWTLLTVAGIRYVCELLNVRASLTGQGDNQVVTLFVPELTGGTEEEIKMNVRNRTTHFITNLTEFFQSIGLPIKEKETWVSSTLFAYGKKLFKEGTVLSMSLKKLCRIFPHSNETIPTLDAAIASISSSMSAGAEMSHYPQEALFVGSFMISIAVMWTLRHSVITNSPLREEIMRFNACRDRERRHIKVKKEMLRSLFTNRFDELILSILWRPKILGGYSIPLLDDLTIKGFPDPLTSALSALKDMHEVLPSKYQKITQSIFDVRLSKDIRPLMLVQDPSSINAVSASTTESLLKSLSEEYISKIYIRNEQIREVVGNTQVEAQVLAGQLFAISPYFPVLISDIFSASLTGLRQRMTQKCSRMTTMQHKAIDSCRRDLQARLERFERDGLLLHIWCVFSPRVSIYHIHSTPCITDYAQKLREEGWQREDLIGITIPPPRCLFGRELETSNCVGNRDFVQLHLAQEIRSEKTRPLEEAGPLVGYIGSETSEKLTKSNQGSEYVVEPLLTMAARLQRAVGWFIREDSFLDGVLKRLMASLTDLDRALFISSQEDVKGSPYHRYNGTLSTKLCRSNLLPQLSTYMTVNTAGLEAHQKGSSNVNLHFQSSLLYIQFLVLMELATCFMQGERPNTLDYHLHIKCNKCIQVLSEEMLEGNEDCEHVKFESCPESKHLFQKATETVKIERMVLHDWYHTIPLSETRVVELTNTACCALGARIISANEQDREYVDTRSILPWVWLGHVRPQSFLSGIIHASLVKAFLSCLLSTRKQHIDMGILLPKANDLIRKIPDFALVEFANIYVDKRSKTALYKDTRMGILSPVETVPNARVAASTLREQLSNLILDKAFVNFHLHNFEPDLVKIQGEMSDTFFFAMWLFNKCIIRRNSLPESEIESIQEWLGRQDGDFSSFFHATTIPIVNVTPDTICKRNPKINLDPPRKNPLRTAITLSISECAQKVLPAPLKWAPPEDIRSFSKISMRQPHIITGAIYRIMTIVPLLSLVRRSSIACFGDGTGGISSLFAWMGHHVHYSTYVDYHHITQEGLADQEPSAYTRIEWKGAGNPPINQGKFASFISDLTNILFCEDFIKEYPNRKFSAFLSDAEGVVWEGEDGLILGYNLLRCAYCCGGIKSNILIKTYSNSPSFLMLVGMMREKSHTMRVLYSRFSTTGSGEVYILATGPFKDIVLSEIRSWVSGFPTDRDCMYWSQEYPSFKSYHECHSIVEDLAIPMLLSAYTNPDLSVNLRFSLRWGKDMKPGCSFQEHCLIALEVLLKEYGRVVKPKRFSMIQPQRQEVGLWVNVCVDIYSLILALIAFRGEEFPLFLQKVDHLLKTGVWFLIYNHGRSVRLGFSVTRVPQKQNLIVVNGMTDRKVYLKKRLFTNLGILYHTALKENQVEYIPISDLEVRSISCTWHRDLLAVQNGVLVLFSAPTVPRASRVNMAKCEYRPVGGMMRDILHLERTEDEGEISDTEDIEIGPTD